MHTGSPRLSSASRAPFTIFRAVSLMLVLLCGPVIAGCRSEPDIGQPVEVIIVPTQAPAAAAEAVVTGVVAEGTVLESLTANPDFALFVAGWERVGRSSVLQDGGPFTIFAPTNVAFSRMGAATAQLDPAALESLLRHHVLGQLVPPDELPALGAVTTSADAPIRLGRRGDRLAIDYATVIGEPVITGNGIIYPVDAVLLPPEPGPERSIWGQMQADERLAALVEAMGGTNTMYLLRFSQEPDAFLAPTNEALAALTWPPALAGLLPSDPLYDELFAYHVMTANGWPVDENLPAAEMAARGTVETPLRDPAQFGLLYTVEVIQEGDDIRVNGARLIERDIPAVNGMLHLIDTVLIPPPLRENE